MLTLPVQTGSVWVAHAQLCLQNEGRPAAAALVGLVRAACQAYAQGIDLDLLLLELEHGGHADHHVNSPGFWLTAADRSYRSQWLKTVLALSPQFWYDGQVRTATDDKILWYGSLACMHHCLTTQGVPDMACTFAGNVGEG